MLAAMGRSASISDLRLIDWTRSGGAASTHLRADDGSPIGVLLWTPRHPGHKLLTYFLPLLVLGVLWLSYAKLALLVRVIAMSRGLEQSEHEALRRANYENGRGAGRVRWWQN